MAWGLRFEEEFARKAQVPGNEWFECQGEARPQLLQRDCGSLWY